MDWISVIEWLLIILCVIIALSAAAFTYKYVGKELNGCVGCLAAGIVAVVAFGVSVGWIVKATDSWLTEKKKQVELENERKETAARIAEEKRQRAEAEIAAKRRQMAKDAKIQAFALKDAPRVWSVYQALQGEIDVQNGKIEELRKTLVAFGKIPEQDVDFTRICSLRDEMVRSRTVLRTKLEDAYIAAKKYEASPSRKDYQALHIKAIEDGILEADAASAKFKEMRLNK